MAKKRTTAEVEAEQPALVPMSEQEIKDASRELARKVGELKDMEAEHKEERADRADERKGLRAEIEAIASTIRQQGR